PTRRLSIYPRPDTLPISCRRGRVERNNGPESMRERPQPVAVCRLKRVAADHKGDVRARMPRPPARRNGLRVACVGAGPSSLTVARDLAPLGYAVTVFEADPRPGGFMRTQVPRFRLPEAVIDEETGYIVDMVGGFVGGGRLGSMPALTSG